MSKVSAPGAKRTIAVAAGIHRAVQKLESKMPITYPHRFWWERMILALDQEADEIRAQLEKLARPLATAPSRKQEESKQL